MASNEIKILSTQTILLDAITTAERRLHFLRQELSEQMEKIAPTILNSVNPYFENLKTSLGDAKEMINNLDCDVKNPQSIYPSLDSMKEPALANLTRTRRMTCRSLYTMEDVIKDYYIQRMANEEYDERKESPPKNDNVSAEDLDEALKMLKLSHPELEMDF